MLSSLRELCYIVSGVDYFETDHIKFPMLDCVFFAKILIGIHWIQMFVIIGHTIYGKSDRVFSYIFIGELFLIATLFNSLINF